MCPATITSTWLLPWHLSGPMLAPLGQGKWAIDAALGPSSRKPSEMVQSEMVRRQRNPARPSYCPLRSVLPSPASSQYQTMLRWGQENLHISGVQLQSQDCLCRLQSKVLWRFQHSIRNKQLMNTPPEISTTLKSGSGGCVSQRNPISILFYSFWPKFNKTASKSLQVIADIEELRRTVWKKQKKMSRVMTREQFS